MIISRQQSPIHIMIDQNQPENEEHSNSLSSIVTNDARCTREIKPRVAMAEAAN
jgi:multidrug resistance efflux pump